MFRCCTKRSSKNPKYNIIFVSNTPKAGVTSIIERMVYNEFKPVILGTGNITINTARSILEIDDQSFDAENAHQFFLVPPKKTDLLVCVLDLICFNIGEFSAFYQTYLLPYLEHQYQLFSKLAPVIFVFSKADVATLHPSIMQQIIDLVLPSPNSIAIITASAKTGINIQDSLQHTILECFIKTKKKVTPSVFNTFKKISYDKTIQSLKKPSTSSQLTSMTMVATPPLSTSGSTATLLPPTFDLFPPDFQETSFVNTVEKSLLCPICFDNSINRAFVACGHMLCVTCERRLSIMAGINGRCSICRNPAPLCLTIHPEGSLRCRCNNDNKSYVLTPCGHMVCAACQKTFLTTRICPRCTQPCQSYFPIYLSFEIEG